MAANSLQALLTSWNMEELIPAFNAHRIDNCEKFVLLNDYLIARILPDLKNQLRFRKKWGNLCYNFGRRQAENNKAAMDSIRDNLISQTSLIRILTANVETRGIVEHYNVTRIMSRRIMDTVLTTLINHLLNVSLSWTVSHQRKIALALNRIFPNLARRYVLFSNPIRRRQSNTGHYVQAKGLVPKKIKKLLAAYHRRIRGLHFHHQ